MNPLEEVTSTLTGAAWVWLKMLVLFSVLPMLTVGLICRYLLRIRGKIIGSIIGLIFLASGYYLLTNYTEIYSWLL